MALVRYVFAYNTNLEYRKDLCYTVFGWIGSICDVFAADQNHAISKFRKAVIATCNDGHKKNSSERLTEDEEDRIEENLNDLLNLSIYSLPTLKINTKALAEDVAEIFIRVNSGRQKLSEKNFIETLLAVYDNEVHNKINRFCEESRIPADKTAYNQIMIVDPVHLIRAAVGLGFKRAQLCYAYMLLRGKDLKTGEISDPLRKENLKVFSYLCKSLHNSGVFFLQQSRASTPLQ